MEKFRIAAFQTRWGWMSALISLRGLRRMTLPMASERAAWEALDDVPYSSHDAELGNELAERLDRYFAGQELAFDMPLDAIGTPFQQAVWQATSAIPRGQTRTYKELAFTVGLPAGARAVGGALRANPIPLVVPCHRVIASDGALGGYAGTQGIALKARLLELESAAQSPNPGRNFPRVSHSG